MGDKDFLADQFEVNRRHLRAVAYRMLGSHSEAEDAVQESWLTTVTARICLDALRTRKIRREEPIDGDAEAVASPPQVYGRRCRAEPRQERAHATGGGWFVGDYRRLYGGCPLYLKRLS
jgi:RNA polymerase sigma-70 factor (ECF subfamily)